MMVFLEVFLKFLLMEIFLNSLYSSKKIMNSNDLDFKILNNLDFREVNLKLVFPY